jgi:hypothetical protein
MVEMEPSGVAAVKFFMACSLTAALWRTPMSAAPRRRALLLASACGTSLLCVRGLVRDGMAGEVVDLLINNYHLRV